MEKYTAPQKTQKQNYRNRFHNSTTDYTCKGNEMSTSKRHLYSCVSCTTAEIRNEPKCAQVETDKEHALHTHNGLSFNHEKERNPVTWSNTDGNGGH